MDACFGAYPEEPAPAAVGLSGADFLGIGPLIDAGRQDDAHAAVGAPMLQLGTDGTPETS
jgi:hypothetical protein